jgi:hypothetical protein
MEMFPRYTLIRGVDRTRTPTQRWRRKLEATLRACAPAAEELARARDMLDVVRACKDAMSGRWKVK